MTQDRKNQLRAARQKWRQSEKGRAWRQTESCKKASAKYAKGPKAKANRRRYESSEKGRETLRSARERKYQDAIALGMCGAHRIRPAVKGVRCEDCLLKGNLRSRLIVAIKYGFRGGSAVRDLQCTIPEFRSYIEALWQPGMAWSNWGKGPGTWQIDHRRPLASFDLTDRKQLLEACCFINLQPLWHQDHVRKTITERGV